MENHYDPNQLRGKDGKWKNEFDHLSEEQKQAMEDNIKNADGVKTKGELKQLLDNAEIPNSVEVSHIYGSHYWTIDGGHFRVADHGKKTDEIYTPGVNDFRDYPTFYNSLKESKLFDLSDKRLVKAAFKKEAEKNIKKVSENIFQIPNGTKFGSIDAATDRMWRIKNEKT